MSKKFIYVIAPHSKCYDVNYRTCDTRALFISDRLEEILNGGIIPNKKLISDAYRSDMDYNRDSAIESDWRKKLHKDIEELSKKYDEIYILECHSFPDKYASFNKDSMMVIYNNKFNQNDSKHFLNDLNKKFNKVFSEIATDEVNSIQRELKKISPKIHAVLLEFNENQNTLTDDVTIEILKGIVEIINIKSFYSISQKIEENTIKFLGGGFNLIKYVFSSYNHILITAIIILICYFLIKMIIRKIKLKFGLNSNIENVIQSKHSDNDKNKT